ncbi:MAG TPA: hypothetical protein VN132_15935, partial [Bdellovibrio sp.]|nr:hypothetical protein [Bdellovibrio sp.]
MRLFNNLGIRAKILATVFISCLMCAVIAVGTSIFYQNKELHTSLASKARTIHSRLDVAARYVAKQGGLKPFVETMIRKYKDS